MMSTLLILLATVHVGASLQQLLNAFVYVPADVPDYSTIYWFDDDATLSVLKLNVYETLVCTTPVLVCQSCAEGNNEGVRPRLYYS